MSHFPVVAKLWNFASDEGTPGAGDNLIASTMAIQVARYFFNNRQAGNPLGHTRLVLASFDAEEAGLRGARDFYRQHRVGEGVLEGTCWNFNVRLPYQSKDLFLPASDINGSVRLSKEMATTCVTIAKSMGIRGVQPAMRRFSPVGLMPPKRRRRTGSGDPDGDCRGETRIVPASTILRMIFRKRLIRKRSSRRSPLPSGSSSMSTRPLRHPEGIRFARALRSGR